ncbi:unnamed protein product [marine sediment metagenome]|uniref:Cohesin domain-containing protein n=1 Tax=marine sediment metagenome TaxID=412755 RepID=X0TZ46_9ZZZZ
MNKGKKIWIALFLTLTLMVILSGCSGLPKTAKINITIEPNPVPYSSENENWPFDIVLDESNGVGVTLSSLRWDEYNQEEQLFNTQFLYEEGIIDWFESNYLPAFSSLQNEVAYYIAPGDEFAKYTVLTFEGVDDNNNSIEATGRVDYLPQ